MNDNSNSTANRTSLAPASTVWFRVGGHVDGAHGRVRARRGLSRAFLARVVAATTALSAAAPAKAADSSVGGRSGWSTSAAGHRLCGSRTINL
jgi:hypothetical protein